MDPIGGISATNLIPLVTDGKAPNSQPGGFGDMVGNAIKHLDQVQKQADDAAVQVATGQGSDIHGALIAIEEASLAFQLALQVRNKIVDSYQEVMRMQV